MADFELNDFKCMMDAMPSCVILHDADSKSILWANRAACTVLGFTLEELLPLKAPDMSSHAEPYRRETGRAWLHGAVLHGMNVIEWCYRAKNGEEILSEAIATLVHLSRQDVVMVQFRDIGREERVKREMKRLESRLKEFMQDSDEGLAVLRAGVAEVLDTAVVHRAVRTGDAKRTGAIAGVGPARRHFLPPHLRGRPRGRRAALVPGQLPLYRD
jgi:two-component system sensor kinase FixL